MFCDYCQVKTPVSLSSNSCNTSDDHRMLISLRSLLLLLLLQMLRCAGNLIEIFIGD